MEGWRVVVPSSWWVTRQARAFVGQKIHLQNSLAAAGHIIAACSRKPSSCGENYRWLPFISGLTIIGAHENESPQQTIVASRNSCAVSDRTP